MAGRNDRGPLTASSIYQVITRRGVQAEVAVHPHRFRHHFSRTWLDRGGPKADLMELCGRTSPQMLRVYGVSARSARARRTYDRVMDNGYLLPGSSGCEEPPAIRRPGRRRPLRAAASAAFRSAVATVFAERVPCTRCARW